MFSVKFKTILEICFVKDTLFLDLIEMLVLYFEETFLTVVRGVALAETTAETENYLILFLFLGFGKRPR